MMADPLALDFLLNEYGLVHVSDALRLSQPPGSHFNAALGPGRLSTATLDEVRAMAARPDAEDADDGPLVAWQHAHRLAFLARWRREMRLRDVRDRAHVFWDQARVDEYGLVKSSDEASDWRDYMMPAYALTLI